MSKKTVFRWKGKIVSEKQYMRHLFNTRDRKEKVPEPALEPIPEPDATETKDTYECVIKGRRVVDFSVLIEGLSCVTCKCALSLRDTEKESRRGLSSILFIRCSNCLLLNPVPTNKSHYVAKMDRIENMCDVNLKAVLGALHSGLGCTHVNKLLACLNIPTIDSHLFKRYERLVGRAAETVAEQSCNEATEMERSLTLKNVDLLTPMLPPELQSQNFITPGNVTGSATHCSPPSRKRHASEPSEIEKENCSNGSPMVLVQRERAAEPSDNGSIYSSQHVEDCHTPRRVRQHTVGQDFEDGEGDTLSNPGHVSERSTGALSEAANGDVLEESCENSNVSFDDVVRVMVSYDMGRSKRGYRDYDSLNGYGAMIGNFSGKVLTYGTRNRKCRLCDLGHGKTDHDCRLNFYGSSKAMEPHLAASLTNNSNILKEKNVQIGILVGDNDSSTIAAVRKVSDHPVVKLSDTNHTSKGVTSELYSIQKKS